jgi:glycosyltransferase involved in cell wall biosynthesis
MRILYVSHYFPPEMGAPAGRVAGLSRQWAEAGHEVHVLTGFPHHPTGVIPPEYRRAFHRGYSREDFHGVHVHRTWIFPAANKGKVRRSANYLSFLMSAAVTGSLRIPRPDVIIATSPQLLCAAAGDVLARRFRVPMVMEIRDLWPESLVAVGVTSSRSTLVGNLERLARGLYRHASHVVTITEAQRAAIVGCGLPESRVSVVPNGVDALFLQDRSSARSCDQFIVTYIGTLGMAHHLETLLEAAELLRGVPAFRFRIVGEGAQRQELEARARAMQLANVEFIGQRPREEVPTWISESDVCLVLLRKTPVFLTVVPSKMIEIMAVGRPIVLGVEGEAKELLERAGAGIGVPPEDAVALAAAIRRLRDDVDLRERCGMSGRQFVEREFRREALAVKYLNILQRLAPTGVCEPEVEASLETESISGNP